VGSIFGIYEPDEACMVGDNLDQSLEACVTNVCQPGRNLLAAGYCLYSSCHTFVLTIGDGVFGFTLDPYVGEFVLTHNRIQVGVGGGALVWRGVAWFGGGWVGWLVGWLVGRLGPRAWRSMLRRRASSTRQRSQQRTATTKKNLCTHTHAHTASLIHMCQQQQQ
jgi:hypothetical protein